MKKAGPIWNCLWVRAPPAGVCEESGKTAVRTARVLEVIEDIIGGGATGPATEDGLPPIDE